MCDCENCSQYMYDEEYDAYICQAYFDEDELAYLMQHSRAVCPYWHSNDEYRTVRRQNI